VHVATKLNRSHLLVGNEAFLLPCLGRAEVPWAEFTADYDRIRDAIESVFPDFKDFNRRIRTPGGFRLQLAATERVWLTPSGKCRRRAEANLVPINDQII